MFQANLHSETKGSIREPENFGLLIEGKKSNLKNTISMNEAADYFGVTTRTIRRWMDKDRNFPLPFKKLGALRFERPQIERYWAENIT